MCAQMEWALCRERRLRVRFNVYPPIPLPSLLFFVAFSVTYLLAQGFSTFSVSPEVKTTELLNKQARQFNGVIDDTELK